MNTESGKSERFKIYLVLFTFVFIFILIIIRLFYLQVLFHDHYSKRADSQYVKMQGVTFDRGNIFFKSKNNNVAVANMYSEYILAVAPAQIKDKDALYNTLNEIVPIDRQLYDEKLSKTNDPYEEIAKGISEDDYNKILNLKLRGVSFVKENKRYYSQNDVASKVIGFVGYDTNKQVGRYGLERYYDDVLDRSGEDVKVNFFARLFADLKTTVISTDEFREGDIYTTINLEAQNFLHKTLIDVQKEWSPELVGGIIMDPRDGSIIAMESLPSYDNNKFSEVKDASVYRNDLVSGVYEMGSIIKPLTVAAGLDSGAINENTHYEDKGVVTINGYKVGNFDKAARGWVPIQTILDKSLNVGIVFVVETMGIDKLREYFKNYGLGSETGIDLPGEESGLVNNLEGTTLVDYATAGFGQGIAITPIQTIRALASLGNGGKLVQPHIVERIKYTAGGDKVIVGDEPVQVLSKETSEEISRMLVHVVDTSLKNGAYKKEHYTVAAKTGTAQIPKPGGGYYEDRYLHSFFGYFPAYDPKYIVFLYQKYPKGAQYASQTLTDPFYNIVDFLISYFEVPPDR